MADLYQKAVDTALLNTWRRSAMPVPRMLTDKGAVKGRGDTVEIPSKAAATVYESESMAVDTATYSKDDLVVTTFRGTNVPITVNQRQQMLGGNANVAEQVMRESAGALQNSIDRACIDQFLEVAAASASNHQNLDPDAVSSDDIGLLEASIREEDGIGGGLQTGFFYLANPRATASIKSVADYIPAQTVMQDGRLGIPVPASLNGIPYFEHSGVPGGVNATRQQSSITASVISSNELTVTVGATEAAKYVVGQYVFTSGLDTNVAHASATPITEISGGDITMALTASNAADNGTGTLYSASAMAFLCYAPWLFYADTGMPIPSMIKRETNAGWTMQLATYIGVKGHAGSVKVLHAPDGTFET